MSKSFIEPKVSVIIPNCDGSRYIFDCLKSVRKSTYSNYEVIVVDNASRDGSPNVIKKDFPNVKLILNRKNLGFTGANNIGMRNASGDIFFLLSDDTIIHEDLIKVLVSELKRHPETGLVGPKIYFMNEPEKIWFAGGRIDWKKSETYHIGRDLIDKELKNDIRKEFDYITGCALMVRREVVDKVGMLNNALFMYYEDSDWAQRMKKAGYQTIYLPFGGVWHAKSATSSRVFLEDLKKEIQRVNKVKKVIIYAKMILRYLTESNMWAYRKYRNRFIFFMKHAPFKYKITFLIRFIFIFTPKFLWEILYKIPWSLIKISWRHKKHL